MRKYRKGEVVFAPFKFSDQEQYKDRPVLVITDLGTDILCCQITSVKRNIKYELPLLNQDFKVGALDRNSYIRVDKINNISKKSIRRSIGIIKYKKFETIKMMIHEIIDAEYIDDNLKPFQRPKKPQ